MELREALEKIRLEFGKEYFLNRNVVSVLADYGAFKNEPSARIIIKLLITEKALEKYLNSNNLIERNQIIQIFINNTGISEERAAYILNLFVGNITTNEGVQTAYDKSAVVDALQENNKSVSNSKYSNPVPKDVSNVSFLGVPMGSDYFSFENALYSKGANFCGKEGYKRRFLLHNFLFSIRSIVSVYQSKYCKKVKRILIQQTVSERVVREERLRQIKDLYESKYGIPSDELTWTINDVKISIKDDNGMFADKVVIEYEYVNPAFLNFEEKEEARLKEQIRLKEIRQQIEKEQKEREEKIRKQQAEIEERNALYNDI